MKQLFDYLIQYGGEIVSSNSLTTEDINQAIASERMYVDENSYGFIWMPPVEKFPETEDEVSLFEKWFPLPVEMPEHLKDSSILFDKIEKKKNREITEREIFEVLKKKYGEEPEWIKRYEELRRTSNMMDAITKLIEEVESETEKRVLGFIKQSPSTEVKGQQDTVLSVWLLKALCDLKDYKDKNGKDDFYQTRQPELWKEAKDFLHKLASQPQEVGQDELWNEVHDKIEEWANEKMQYLNEVMDEIKSKFTLIKK